VKRNAVRRWIAGHRAAEHRSLELMRHEGPMSPELSFRAAMELCDLADHMDPDPVREREVETARRLWTRLKKPWVRDKLGEALDVGIAELDRGRGIESSIDEFMAEIDAALGLGT
jgi:hypothetical protein